MGLGVIQTVAYIFTNINLSPPLSLKNHIYLNKKDFYVFFVKICVSWRKNVKILQYMTGKFETFLRKAKLEDRI